MTLQIMRVYSLSCDAPGCDGWSDEVVPRADDPAKERWARRELHSTGWVTRGSYDYCPEHAAPCSEGRDEELARGTLKEIP